MFSKGLPATFLLMKTSCDGDVCACTYMCVCARERECVCVCVYVFVFVCVCLKHTLTASALLLPQAQWCSFQKLLSRGQRNTA